MAIERSARRVAAARLHGLARGLLDASTLCAIATVRRCEAHVHTAYFAWASRFRLVWMSDPSATHSRNIRANPSVAIAVFDSSQLWGRTDRGLQLFGTASELDDAAAADAALLYQRRFRRYRRSDLSVYRFYEFRPYRMKLFDEAALGDGTFVTATVGPSGVLRWERTEIYRGSRF